MKKKNEPPMDDCDLVYHHQVRVEVNSWHVHEGIHTPSSWRLYADGEMYEMTTYRPYWSRWFPKADSWSAFGGSWRKCGPRQQETIGALYAAAERLNLIADRYYLVAKK